MRPVSFQGVADVGPAWVESPGGTSVMGHARWRTGFWSGQRGGPGRYRRHQGQVKSKARHRGQIRSESPGIAGTDPGGNPPRTAGNDTHKSVGSGLMLLTPW